MINENRVIISVTPMSQSEYDFKYGTVNLHDLDEGYELLYSDGSSSWMSTKEYDETGSSTVSCKAPDKGSSEWLDFSSAVKILNAGIPVTRYSFSDKDSFIFKSNSGYYIGVNEILHCKFLPDKIRIILSRRTQEPALFRLPDLYIVDTDGTMKSWFPTSEDLFATDWMIYND